MKTLMEAVGARLPEYRERVARLRTQHGNGVVSTMTLSQLCDGMHGVATLLCDTSSVPADRGLIIRGTPIRGLTGLQPEAIFWLMLTSELPTPDELAGFQAELRERARRMPALVWRMIDVFARSSHPMRAFSVLVATLGEGHRFTNLDDAPVPGGSRYRDLQGTVAKADQWKLMLDDCITLIACLPAVAAYIYRLSYGKGTRLDPLETGTWTQNFAHLLGVQGDLFEEFLRLYLVLQCDHEGGNVSAHTNLVVSSGGADIFYSLQAGLCGLAGPHHGLAAQQCLQWVKEVHQNFGTVPTREQLDAFVDEQLRGGKVVPGYGHAVLRCVDPRFLAMIDFGERHCPEDPLFQIVKLTYVVAPEVLKRQGRAKNPRPNTDAVPGAIWTYCGVPEAEFYTVFFGVSRALGLCAQAVLARGLNLPIERPLSITTEALEQMFVTASVPVGVVET